MSAYYPSQGSYSHHGQPVVYTSGSRHGRHQSYGQPYSNDYYGEANGGVVYVPTHSSGRSHGRRHHHSHSVPTGPVVIQPSHHSSHQDHHHHSHRRRLSLGERLRRFFGLAPSSNYRYKSNHSNWGFMGHSQRQRYVDARSGGEVDRRGRPIYRV